MFLETNPTAVFVDLLQHS